jgi:predicted Zn-dependent peptidase
MLQTCNKSVARYLAATLAIFISSHSFSGELYKTVDSKGHTVYSDHPVSGGSQKIAVQVKEPDPEDAARLAKEQAMSATLAERQAQQRALAEKNRAAQAISQQQQNQRCNAARSRRQLFADGGLIYKRDEQGNRTYYSNEEIEALRVETQTTVEKYCGG